MSAKISELLVLEAICAGVCAFAFVTDQVLATVLFALLAFYIGVIVAALTKFGEDYLQWP